MKKLTISIVSSALLLMSSSLLAAVDYLDFAKNTLLGCAHPTADAKEAKAEYVNPPALNGDVTTARVRVFYKGWIKSNSMLVDIHYREAGSIKQIKAEVLEDSSSTGHSGDCTYPKGWQDI